MTEPAASNLLPSGDAPEAPTMTTAQAYEKRDALMHDPEYQRAYLAGDPAKLAEMKLIAAAMTGPSAVLIKSDGVDKERRVETFANFAELPPDVLKQMRDGSPVSADEQKAAAQRKQMFMKDREWVRRYLDGGMAERQQMALISIILGSPVASK